MSSLRGNTDFEFNLAVQKGDARKIRTLIKHGAKPPKGLMLFALIRRHPELLGLLKEAGANPNDSDGFSETALGNAVNYYSIETVQTLLDFGADPNKESLHLLPLVHAMCFGKIECIKLLLRRGADPNRPQWNGLTPLLAAVHCENIEATRLFLEAGAGLGCKGPGGKNAMQMARSLGRTDLIELLKSFEDAQRKGLTKRAAKTKFNKSKVR